MRRGNQSDGGHDKITWKRIRGLLTRRRDNVTLRRTTTTLLDVSFEIYRRRCGYVPLKRLDDVPARLRWVFHLRLAWDVVKTYWWDVAVTCSWDVITTSQKDVAETYHWDVLTTFHRDVVGCFIWDVFATSLGRTERRRYDVATTSCCRMGNALDKITHYFKKLEDCKWYFEKNLLFLQKFDVSNRSS